MCSNSIAFHLTYTQTALLPTPTRRLTCPLLLSSFRTCVPLILCHVLQAHTEHRPHKHTRLHLFSTRSVIQDEIIILLKPELSFQNTPNCLRRRRVARENRGVSNHGILVAHLAEQHLHELCNRHTTWNTVRIHQHIWH